MRTARIAHRAVCWGGALFGAKMRGEGDGHDGTLPCVRLASAEIGTYACTPIWANPLLSLLRVLPLRCDARDYCGSVSAVIVRRSIIIGNQQPRLARCGPEHLRGGTGLEA